MPMVSSHAAAAVRTGSTRPRSAQLDRFLADHHALHPHFGRAVAPEIARQTKAFAGLDLGARQPARFHAADRRQDDVPDLILPAHFRPAVRVAPRPAKRRGRKEWVRKVKTRW